MKGPLLTASALAAIAFTLAATGPEYGGSAGVSSAALPEAGAPVGKRTRGFYSPPPAFLDAAQERPCLGSSPERFHEFYFTRAIYNDGGGFGRGGGAWRTDYPKSDCQFIVVTQRLAGLDMYQDANAIRLDDPSIRDFPFLYALEVGRNGGWRLTDAEAEGLRSYLLAGGFLVIDDFWGTREWANFEVEMRRVLPGRPIVDIPMDHVLLRVFYTIDEIIQVPSINNWTSRGITYQQDGYVPHLRGIFDEQGRLMVAINWNTDLGDAWEWAENPFYPLQFSTFAFEMGVNMILYSMTH